MKLPKLREGAHKENVTGIKRGREEEGKRCYKRKNISDITKERLSKLILALKAFFACMAVCSALP